MNNPVMIAGHTYDAEGGSERLHAGQLAGLAVVDGIGCHQIWQQPGMRPHHLTEGSLLQLGPRTVDDCQSVLSHDGSDQREDCVSH